MCSECCKYDHDRQVPLVGQAALDRWLPYTVTTVDHIRIGQRPHVHKGHHLLWCMCSECCKYAFWHAILVYIVWLVVHLALSTLLNLQQHFRSQVLKEYLVTAAFSMPCGVVSSSWRRPPGMKHSVLYLSIHGFAKWLSRTAFDLRLNTELWTHFWLALLRLKYIRSKFKGESRAECNNHFATPCTTWFARQSLP